MGQGQGGVMSGREKVESIDLVLCLSFWISYSFYHVKNKEVMV